MQLNKILGFTLCALLAAFALRGQNFDADEIRTSTRPYVPPAGTGMRFQSNLVELRVTVRDSKGNPASGLGQADFQVFDNGKQQVISTFSVETAEARPLSVPVPSTDVGAKAAPAQPASAPPLRFVAFFFDDTNTQLGELAQARAAVQKYMSGSLQPGSVFGVFTSSSEVTQDFTGDPRKILAALARVRPHFRTAGDATATCPRLNPHQAHLIAERNDPRALDLAIAEALAENCFSFLESGGGIKGSKAPTTVPQDMIRTRAREVLTITENYSKETLGSLQSLIQFLGTLPGRRTLLLASSGFFTASSPLLRLENALVDLSVRNGVVINSLDAKGLAASVPGGDMGEGHAVAISARPDLMIYSEQLRNELRELNSDTLAVLAQGTGGRFFHDNNDLERGVRELASAPETSYVISFAPAGLKPDGSYHNLKVKLARPGDFNFDTRRGYFAPENSNSAQPAASEKFETALMASNELATIPVELRTRTAPFSAEERILHVVVHVNTAKLPFERRGDRHVQRLRFVVALFDQNGKFQAGSEAVMDLTLKDATRATFASQGLEQQLSVRAPAGTYRLRAVVQELVQSRITSLNRPVQIQ